MHEIVTQKEFTDKYNSGQREFTGVLMQFFDISGMKISDLTIKNSKIMFCNFSNCELKNVRIAGCTIYYANFYVGTADGVAFDRCDIEQMLFDTFSFSRTAFKHCEIRWSGILNSNSGSIDISTSSQYKFFTDLMQVTPQDIDEAVKLVMHDIERLDLNTRIKIKEMIRQDFEKYDMNAPEEKGSYERKQHAGDDSPLTYGEVKGLVETTFGAYGTQGVYRAKKSIYEKDGTYRP